MTNDDRAEAQQDKAARAAQDAQAAKAEREAASKAVLDNMAKLRALRLAREAAAPPPPVKARKVAAKSKKPGEKGAAKSVALSDWLASQQSGGRRT